MACYHAPAKWEDWSNWLAAGLQGQSRWRLAPLMLGVLFACGRRTVTSWLRAAGVSDDFRSFYYFLQSVGLRWFDMGSRVLMLVNEQALDELSRVLLVIDDSPTKRYGPHVEGAGTHHDPTPGATSHPFCYGHVWVTLAVAVRHPCWGTIGLPIWSWLYVRQCDIAQLAESYNWTFRTKLEQAADLVEQAAAVLKQAGKQVWAVADGAYTKRPFVKRVMAAGVTLVGRLRKDAALRDLPPKEKKRRRGRKRKYGLNRISLAKRAAHPRGWEDVECVQYGRTVIKTVKTFLATHTTFGGAVRVVIVKEKNGPEFFYCTDTSASVAEILEAYADRSAIEQVFHDVKEVWGSAQQQVRNLWTNIAVWHLNLWLHTLVELWAWNRPAHELVHRRDSPWDDAQRRPSHADRRKSLQATCLENEFSRAVPGGRLPRKMRDLLTRLLRIAV
jgi:hypothetical protein